MNIRTKLTVLFCSIVAFILVVFSISIFYFYSLYREKDFFDRLDKKAHKTVELLFQLNDVDAKVLQIIDKYDLQTLFDEEALILDTKKNEVYKTLNNKMVIDTSLINQVILNKKIETKDKSREVIGLSITANAQIYYVFISAIDKYGLEKLNKLELIISIGCLLSILIVFFAGYYFSTKALEPIKMVVKQVDTINVSNLNMRVQAGTGNDEIAQLSATFNKMLERLEESFAMQKNFVSNASHELRTPLTSIRGNIEVTLMQSRTNEEYQAVLHAVFEDISRLTKMTNGLLELARITSLGTKLQPEPIRIDEVLWQSKDEVEQKNKKYKVKLSFENFPEEEEALVIMGNESLLKTSFVNLMENACKFSSNHTSEVLLVVYEKYVKIVFIDNGVGIKEEDLPHIFEPFYRSSSSRQMPSGYGIGLSLVEKIITIHKGRIDVSTFLQKGTIFTVNLPKFSVVNS